MPNKPDGRRLADIVYLLTVLLCVLFRLDRREIIIICWVYNNNISVTLRYNPVRTTTTGLLEDLPSSLRLTIEIRNGIVFFWTSFKLHQPIWTFHNWSQAAWIWLKIRLRIHKPAGGGHKELILRFFLTEPRDKKLGEECLPVARVVCLIVPIFSPFVQIRPKSPGLAAPADFLTVMQWLQWLQADQSAVQMITNLSLLYYKSIIRNYTVVWLRLVDQTMGYVIVTGQHTDIRFGLIAWLCLPAPGWEALVDSVGGGRGGLRCSHWQYLSVLWDYNRKWKVIMSSTSLTNNCSSISTKLLNIIFDVDI